jgi:hypothetical protein
VRCGCRTGGAGRLEHANERRGFEHVETIAVFVGIRARRHLDAERVEHERHTVEIGLEDLALGVDRFDLECRDRLLDLAREATSRPILSW